MLKGCASTFYYDCLAGKGYDFNHMIYKLQYHFETEENKQQYLSEWRETTFLRIIAMNPGVSRLECLQKLFDRLQTIQCGLVRVCTEIQSKRRVWGKPFLILMKKERGTASYKSYRYGRFRPKARF
jgi:hypothetical protein